MKALDIYLSFCFFMVFGALMEYATISYTVKRIKLNQRRLKEFKAKVKRLKMFSRHIIPCSSDWPGNTQYNVEPQTISC